MLDRIYVSEKLRELEAERARRRHQAPPPETRPAFATAVGGLGRALRRIGEGLETWATPAPQDRGWQGALAVRVSDPAREQPRR